MPSLAEFAGPTAEVRKLLFTLCCMYLESFANELPYRHRRPEMQRRKLHQDRSVKRPLLGSRRRCAARYVYLYFRQTFAVQPSKAALIPSSSHFSISSSLSAVTHLIVVLSSGKRCVVEGCRKPAYERNGNMCSLHQVTNAGALPTPDSPDRLTG